MVGALTCVVLAGGIAACGLSIDRAEPVQTSPVQPADTAPDPTTTVPTAPTTSGAPDPTTTVTIAPTTSGAPDSGNDGDPTRAPTGPVSFAADVQPIVTETCARCHTGDGPGTPHVRFDTAGDIAETSGFVALAVASGFMPPWPAGELSVPFDHDWSLTDEEIAAIVRWDEAGAPLDVAIDAPMIPTFGTLGLPDPDLRIPASGSYDGQLGQPDEYRCFVYDPMVDQRSFVQSMEFIPEQTPVVHHAVGFRVSERDRAAIDEMDGADGQGGWSCFGFSPGRSAEIVFTWAPGQAPTTYPDGTGLELSPGDFFVMQTHYHYGVEAPADRSTVAIDWADPGSTQPVQLATYLAPAEIPCSTRETGPLCDRAAARALLVEAYGPEGVLADLLVRACGYELSDFAGMTSGIASSSCDQPVQSFGEIVSVFGHEHELGKSFRMTLNPGTPDELILLDIPKWTFDWQLIYEPTESIVLEPGDWVRIECTWDRSLRDESLEPAYVMWADGTDDEMCFSAIVTRPT